MALVHYEKTIMRVDPEGYCHNTKQTHVLFLSVRADFGGGPEHLWQLLRHLPPGFRASVACPQDYPYFERYRGCVGTAGLFKLGHRRFSLRLLMRLRQFCLKNGVDVLHAHGKGAGYYSRLLTLLTGIPSVYTFHGVHIDGYGSVKKIIYCIYEKLFSLITCRAIAVSDGERRAILKYGLMPENKIVTIKNGICMPEPASALPAGPPWKVVSFSRFDFQKNSRFIMDIVEELAQMGRNDFVFYLVGDGPDRETIVRLAEKSGIEVHCPGATEKPHEYFEGALCYLSTSRWEGMPLAVLEAMAHGLPPVATDVVGNFDVIKDGETGLLFRSGDPVAAATALCRLADAPIYRQNVASAAHNYVKRNHDVQKMVFATYDLLQRIVNTR